MRRYDNVQVGLCTIGVLRLEQLAQHRHVSEAGKLDVVGQFAFLGEPANDEGVAISFADW